MYTRPAQTQATSPSVCEPFWCRSVCWFTSKVVHGSVLHIYMHDIVVYMQKMHDRGLHDPGSDKWLSMSHSMIRHDLGLISMIYGEIKVD